MATAYFVTLFVFISLFVNNGIGVARDSCGSSTDVSQLLSFLGYLSSVLKEAKDYTDNFSGAEKWGAIDCAALADGKRSSGVYTVRPRSRVVDREIRVTCDLEDDGGGWTVIQRRGDFNSSKDYFYRDWNSYKNGFGDIEKDFWIGNDIIFSLTNQRPCSLKVVLTDFEGNTTYATYDDFWIEGEVTNYTLHVSGYRGNAGDSFASRHDGAPFSTKDRNNDSAEKNCAESYKGAWWYTKCHSSNLNGQYLRGPHTSYADGVNWKTFRNQNYSLKDTFMKIRPKNFILQRNL